MLAERGLAVRLPYLCIVAFGVLLFGASAVRGASQDVQLTIKGESLEVTIGGQPFTVYNFAKTQKKPYFSPVRGPEGQIMSRPLLDPNGRAWRDHQHHKGIWFSIDEVNGIKFWAERGKIENVSVEPIASSGNPARFKTVNNWLGKDGQPVLIESTTVSIFANRVIAYDAQLTAAKNPVTFEDTKEGFFGFRMVDSMRGKAGSIVSSDGHHGEGECWGKQFDWVDYDGPVDGKTVGIAIFDNPHNFRRSRYHVRSYGLFSISPFGEKAYTNGANAAAPLTLKPGASLRLRYAMYIHDGDTKSADVAGTYQKYVAAAEQTP